MAKENSAKTEIDEPRAIEIESKKLATLTMLLLAKA